MIVDWQHHWMTERQFEAAGGVKGQYLPGFKDGKTTVFLYDDFYMIERQLAWMDSAGVDLAVLSGGSSSGELAEAQHWADGAAKVLREHPKRFAVLGPALPLGGPKAMDEIDRCIDELGFRGVEIRAQINDEVPLDSPELRPFWAKMAQRNVPIFVHVSSSARGFDAVNAEWDANITLIREFDLATAACRIILGGVLDQFPSLTFVFAHLGGGIAAIWERVERYATYWGARFWGWDRKEVPLSRPVHEYLEMLYFDLAGFEGGMNAVKCALTTFSPQRLVFGTDYPPNFVNDGAGVRRYVQNIRNLGLSAEDTEAILGANASRLLRL